MACRANGSALELQQDEGTLLRFHRRDQAARGHLIERGQRLLGIAAIGEGPCVDQRDQEREITGLAAGGQPRRRAIRMTAPDLVGNEQEPRVRRELRRRNLPREIKRKVHLPSPDRLAQRLARDIGLVWLGLSQRGEKLRRARMVAVHRGSARFDIGPRSVGNAEPRRGGRRNECEGRNGGSCQQTTCSGNWVLRRLRE